MIVDEVNRLGHSGIGVGEPVEPAVEVYAAVAHQRDMLLVDAAGAHEREHLLGIHPLHAAARVADDHYLVDSQFIDRYQERAYGRVEGIGDGASGIFDDFHIAVFDAERRREQFHQAGVHAGDYGDAFVGVF